MESTKQRIEKLAKEMRAKFNSWDENIKAGTPVGQQELIDCFTQPVGVQR